jgi:hypothetical protein
LTINTGNTQVSPPSFGTSGGMGDRIICWNGAPSSLPLSQGIDNSTLWYSVPTGCSHKLYVENSVSVSIKN